MKKIVLLLGLVFLSWINADAQLFCSYKKAIDYPFPTFYSLKHSPQVYSPTDINTLRNIGKDFSKQEKNYRCFLKHYEKFANYKRLVNVGLKRYEKKMYREDRKAQKYGTRFVNVALMAYLDLDSLYSAKIFDLQAKNKLPDSLKYIAEGLKQDIQELTFQIGQTKSQAISAHGAEKTNLFIKSIILNKKKIELKEDYIALLVGNQARIAQLKQRYVQLKQEQSLTQQPPEGQQGQTQRSQGQTTGDQQTKQRQTQYSRTTYYIFRIDQLSQKLRLTSQEKQWLTNYREAQDSIQRLESLLNQDMAMNPGNTLAKLASLYWKAYNSLFKIYSNYLPEPGNEKIYNTQKISKELHDKYLKNKDIGLLWQANHYLGEAIILMENKLSDRYNIGGNYLTSDILPTTSSAEQKTTTQQPKKTTAQPKPKTKVNCTPSGLVYSYSIDNPTPKLLREEGTFYRVYVGTTTRQVLPKEFSDYQPITYVRVCRESSLRQKHYYVGKFATYQEAKKAANKLYTQFGIHTKVVKFINGKPAVGLPTQTPQQQRRTVQGVENIHDTKYLVYAVRIGTFSDPKSPSQLKHIGTLYYTTTGDNKFAYYDGLYYTYSSALNALSKLRNLGYHDAYIEAFNNGQKISINRAKQIEQASKGNGQVIFGIQVGAYSKPLSQEDYRKTYASLGAQYQISMIKKGQMYVYYVYAGTTYNQAKQLKTKIRNLGYSDAFIIAIRDNKVVPLNQVIR